MANNDILILQGGASTLLKALVRRYVGSSQYNVNANFRRRTLCPKAFVNGLTKGLNKKKFIRFMKSTFDGLEYVIIQKHFAFLFDSEENRNNAVGKDFVFDKKCFPPIQVYKNFKRRYTKRNETSPLKRFLQPSDFQIQSSPEESPATENGSASSMVVNGNNS